MDKLEYVMEKYKLSREEHDEIGERIKQIMFYDKFPVEHPKAIIDIAPPGSGKTGLNGYGKESFVDNNVIIINGDELKPFHPKMDEIVKLYPQFYTEITERESNTWTSELFDTALRQGYNIIFEGTGQNTRILETIKNKMQGYEILVRGMAVNELNCLISIVERYECQLQTKGWGRLVTLEHFYKTYSEMPKTIDEIEKSGKVHMVEVFKRGSLPCHPRRIYNSENKTGAYITAKHAVYGGRDKDKEEANMYFEKIKDKMKGFLENEGTTEVGKSIVEKIFDLNTKYKAEQR